MVVEPPDEIDVLAEPKLVVKAEVERLAAHHQTGARYVVHRSTGHDDSLARTHVEGTEALLEMVADPRTVVAAHPRGAGTELAVLELSAQARQGHSRAGETDVVVHEAEEGSRRCIGAGVTRGRSATVHVESHQVDAEFPSALAY